MKRAATPRRSKVRAWKLRENPRSVEFTVYGIARPKGSMQGFVAGGRAVVTEKQGSPSRKWQHRIADEAQRHAPEGGPLDGPLIASVVFYLPRPTSAPKMALVAADKKPDADKLLRALNDALRGVIIADDARIVRFLDFGKFYSVRPRAEIAVWEATADDLPPVEEAEAEQFGGGIGG